MGARWRSFCSSVPWAMIVGPSMPTPIASRIPGRPARLISWPMMTCSIGPRPWPPYSWGHVTPTSPPSASCRCQARWAAMAASSLSPTSPARGGGLVRVLLEPGAHLRAVLGLLGRVVEIHGVLLLADWPVGIADDTGYGPPAVPLRRPRWPRSALSSGAQNVRCAAPLKVRGALCSSTASSRDDLAASCRRATPARRSVAPFRCRPRCRARRRRRARACRARSSPGQRVGIGTARWRSLRPG